MLGKVCTQDLHSSRTESDDVLAIARLIQAICASYISCRVPSLLGLHAIQGLSKVGVLFLHNAMDGIVTRRKLISAGVATVNDQGIPCTSQHLGAAAGRVILLCDDSCQGHLGEPEH